MRATGRKTRHAAGWTLAAVFVIAAGAAPARAEPTASAIERIRSGRHADMPPPQMAHAMGSAGKGMTIENGTGHVLRVHFSGPVTKSVDVPDGSSTGVELAVGAYEVAAEVPEAPIVPFYGKQDYRPNTHYWLRFFVRSAWR
jgi:hypothetical protein